MSSAQTISVENVTKTYGNFKAVDGMNASVERGGVWALLGPNGCGKTTLLKCMTGLIHYEGDIFIHGHDIREEGVAARKKIGYVPQRPTVYDNLTVIETMKFYASIRKVKFSRITELLEFVGLELWGRSPVGALSMGMKQRLMLAVSLLSDPSTLLLDEPTASLDVRRQLEFRSLLNILIEEGKTILITTHLLGDVDQIARNIIVMNKGKLVTTGSVKDLMADLNLTAHMYIELEDPTQIDSAMSVLEKTGARDVSVKEVGAKPVMIMGVEPSNKLPILQSLDTAGHKIKDFTLEEPNLEDAFMKLTGEDEK